MESEEHWTIKYRHFFSPEEEPTLRDMYAMAALPEVVKWELSQGSPKNIEEAAEIIANRTNMIADACMEQRKK